MTCPTQPGWDTYTFPCVPVSMIVAKDVTIRFQTQANQTNVANDYIHRESNAGGGFLCFRMNSSEAHTTDTKHLATSAEGNTVSIKIPGPFLLGFIQQGTS